jgi:hypothetical protein
MARSRPHRPPERQYRGGRQAPTILEFARLSVALAGPPTGRLIRIIRDTSEPLALRCWAYDSLPPVAGLSKARDFARSLEDREPALLFRTAVLLDDAECLRELAAGPTTAVAVEAMGALVDPPSEEKRSSRHDTAAAIHAAGPVRGELLRQLGDPVATDFLSAERTLSRARLAALDALAECARVEALPWLRGVVRTLHGVERVRGHRTIARIVERAGNLTGGLTSSAQGGGELAMDPEAGHLSPATGSPAPRD